MKTNKYFNPHLFFPGRSEMIEKHRLRFVHCGAVSPSPPDAFSDHGESSEDALRFGAAVKIASTPASNVIAVTAPESEPSVDTIITASPFCRSASVLLGKRLNIRCKSGGPFPLGPRPDWDSAPVLTPLEPA
jgi:hypothetical protein